MWPTVGIVAAFLITFILVICKVNIGISLISGSVILGLFFLPLPRLMQAIFDAFVALSTLELVATITSITFLNFVYQSTGKSQELAESLGKMIPSTSLVAVIPVLFSVLPVSGGALFSAPLVDSEGDRLGMEKERKAFLNMWFRHIPHLLYPLETALVITSYLTNVNLATIILYQVPVFATGIAIGYLLGLRGIGKRREVLIKWYNVKKFFVSFLPIFVAVTLTAILGVKVFIAVFVGTILLFVIARPKWVDITSTVSGVGKMALVGFGIMIFRHIVEVSGALDIAAKLVQTCSVWPPILLVFLPMSIGFALGESTLAITLSLSILLATYEFSPPAACLAYTCMYFGNLISPIHLCFAVTSEYFQTGTLQIYKRLIPATIATLSIGIPLMILLM